MLSQHTVPATAGGLFVLAPVVDGAVAWHEGTALILAPVGFAARAVLLPSRPVTR
jgi:hypothetical protein